MNTTPSTSKLTYSIVGGDDLAKLEKGRPGLSIILINSGAHSFRQSFFNELDKIQAIDIISIEYSPCPHDVSTLLQMHQRLRFIIFAGDYNLGTCIDVASQEVFGSHFLVISGQFMVNIADFSNTMDQIIQQKQLCNVPIYQDKEGEPLPTAMAPLPDSRGHFEVQPTPPKLDQTPSLFPWRYGGIYNKELHHAIGGFDPLINENWWQLLEYGTRAWLWGQSISVNIKLKSEINEAMPPIDTSVGPGYRRFYFKMLAVRRRGVSTHLPRRRLYSYVRKSGDNFFIASRQWREISQWVEQNSHRYVLDAAGLLALWNWSGT